GGARARDAARCLSAADALLPPGHVAVRGEREARRCAESRLRSVLGDAAYEEAYAQGDGLAPEEAVALIEAG
ncbi:hypothetical protein G3I38_34735, partial [Streptomyces sp. SID7958]|nr:hypothetical protein [Streptomyces sp. SID7958]